MIFIKPSYALVVDAQKYTRCDYGYCETYLELEPFMSANQIKTLKETNIRELLPSDKGIRNLNYRFDKNRIIIYGNIEKNTYWNMNLTTSLSIDPWWNNSWANCKNISIEIYQTEDKLPVTVNITNLTLTNSYEGRLLNTSCFNNDTVQNYTVLDSYTAGVNDDWADIEFIFSGSANTTWSFYYNNSGATNENYLATLFSPNFYESCDWTNEWTSISQGLYVCANGYMLASAVQSASYNETILTKNDYSIYPNITVYDIIYDSNTANNKQFNRYLVGKNVSISNNEIYGLYSNNDNPDEFGIFWYNPSVQTYDSGIDIPTNANFSNKLWYSQPSDAYAWVKNTADDSLIFSKNVTDESFAIKYYGLFADYSRTAIKVYKFKIYFGYVNPREYKLPKITVGIQENLTEYVPPPLPTFEIDTFFRMKSKNVYTDFFDSENNKEFYIGKASIYCGSIQGSNVNLCNITSTGNASNCTCEETAFNGNLSSIVFFSNQSILNVSNANYTNFSNYTYYLNGQKDNYFWNITGGIPFSNLTGTIPDNFYASNIVKSNITNNFTANQNFSYYNLTFLLSSASIPTCSKYYNTTGNLIFCECYNNTHKWIGNTC